MAVGTSHGMKWKESLSGKLFLDDVAWSGRQYAAVGVDGRIFTSLNGVNWTENISGTANNQTGAAWDIYANIKKNNRVFQKTFCQERSGAGMQEKKCGKLIPKEDFFTVPDLRTCRVNLP